MILTTSKTFGINNLTLLNTVIVVVSFETTIVITLKYIRIKGKINVIMKTKHFSTDLVLIID